MTGLKNILFVLSAFLFSVEGFAQQVIFQSARTAEPLSNVQVFTPSGMLMATSDVQGAVDKSELQPAQENYILIYDGYKIASLKQTDFAADTIKLNDRIKEIAEVTIKSSGKRRYLVIRGHFNVYMTVNKELNVYADGIAAYTFDSTTKKLRNAQVEQYRAFSIDQAQENDKKTNTIAYQPFLKLPDLGKISTVTTLKNKKKNYYEVLSEKYTKMQYDAQALQDKALSIFGYRFYDFEYKNIISFSPGSKNLRDFKEFDERMFFKFKHKSEPHFHQMIRYSVFIPVEVSFADTISNKKLNLEPTKSSYSYDFWKAHGFPNMQPLFSDFFKESFKEQPNSRRK